MRTVTVFALLAVALVVSATAGILVGAVPIAPGDVLSALFGAEGTNGTIIRELRLPRVLGAALVGGALAAAGALLQGMLRNPLADPFVTGTSAGASLGAVVAIALGFEPALVPLAAFVGAMAAITLVWRLARLGGRTTVLTVLLAGVVLTSFAGALVTFVLVSSDRLALRLRAVLGWLQGGVSVINWSELAVASIVVAVGVIAALLLAPRIDAYAFGEETAAALGVDLDRTTAAVLATTALLTGAAVAIAGLVGFVGLVIPHALRFLLGATHRRLLVASVPAGAIALVLADLGARTALAPAELPVGVITGLVGAPFFLVLLVRSRREIV
ncbi:MAG TPA: iron ABC transporter permease [Candidatus Limnocylindria bacterium]|nr:iron ABC transporter permease [Candidatus Limnocylindria bacterium]